MQFTRDAHPLVFLGAGDLSGIEAHTLVETCVIDGNAGVLIHMDPCGTVFADGKDFACWQNCSERPAAGQEMTDDSGRFVKVGGDK